MPLQYIYAGYSKCGTKTLAEVFRTLNFKVCDFEETVLDCAEHWREFYNGATTHERRIQVLKEAFQDFDVCMDAPCYIYWQELMQAFPEAKCIFYEREEEAWVISLEKQLNMQLELFPGTLPDWCLQLQYQTGMFPPVWKNTMDLIFDMYPDMLNQKPGYLRNWYGEKVDYNYTRARRAYRSHNANFLKNCPLDKRLILKEINCGWEVICDFVGKEVPDIPYPHKNKNASINKEIMEDSRLARIYTAHIKSWCKKVIVCSVVGGVLVWKRDFLKEVAGDCLAKIKT